MQVSSQPKWLVLQRFLDFVEDYVPLREARIATLGGKGWEARLWLERGVAPESGWLIERNPDLRAYHLRHLPFNSWQNLRSFPAVLRTITGNRTSIDAFHLDLCGTLEPSVEDFRPILPLLTNSARGGCLAVTIADERRSRTLEEFAVLRVRTDHLLGRTLAEGFFRHLWREQSHIPRPQTADDFLTPANPEKGASREYGCFLHLFSLLVAEGAQALAVPDRIERYVYVSRYERHPFRMRTYLFHLAKPRTVPVAVAARTLAQRWQESPLFVFRDSVFSQIDQLFSVESEKRRKEQFMFDPHAFDKLGKLAEAAGLEHQQQFSELLKLAMAGATLQETVRSVRAALGASAEERTQRPPTARTTTPPSEPATVANGDKLKVQFDLVYAAAQGDEALERAYEQAYEELDLKGRRYSRTRRRIVGGLLARTQRGHRPNFLKRVVAVLGADRISEDLARAYSTITGERVTLAELHEEAGL